MVYPMSLCRCCSGRSVTMLDANSYMAITLEMDLRRVSQVLLRASKAIHEGAGCEAWLRRSRRPSARLDLAGALSKAYLFSSLL